MIVRLISAVLHKPAVICCELQVFDLLVLDLNCQRAGFLLEAATVIMTILNINECLHILF